jgi:hypothetical protein
VEVLMSQSSIVPKEAKVEQVLSMEGINKTLGIHKAINKVELLLTMVELT